MMTPTTTVGPCLIPAIQSRQYRPCTPSTPSIARAASNPTSRDGTIVIARSPYGSAMRACASGQLMIVSAMAAEQ